MPKLFRHRQHYDACQLNYLSEVTLEPTLHRSCRVSERGLSQYGGSPQPASSVRTVGFTLLEACCTSKSSLFVKPEAVCSGQHRSVDQDRLKGWALPYMFLPAKRSCQYSPYDACCSRYLRSLLSIRNLSFDALDIGCTKACNCTLVFGSCDASGSNGT